MEVVFVEEQPIAGKERPVRPGATVGRGGADFELADPEVSRQHAVFRQVDAGLALEDLGSTNGTFVNDRPIDGITPLSDGDRIRFGNTIWRMGAVTATPRPDPDRPPTALRAVIPTEVVHGEQAQFNAPQIPSPVLGLSAARRVEYTLYCYLAVLVAAAGVAYFFAQR
jgi:predicted component of type VI protein secretion system